MNKLVILRGLPGSGKSTIANLLVSNPDHVFEADKYFYRPDGTYLFNFNQLHSAHEWCKYEVESAMKSNIETIVVSNTSTVESEFKYFIELAESYDYDVFSLIVENRHGHVSVHDVPEITMEKMEKRFSVKLR